MLDTISTYFNHLIYGYYPYRVGTVFLLGSLMRYDHGQFTWKTGSSQMLTTKNMRLASNLFHVGIIVIFFRPPIRDADTALDVRPLP